MNKNVVLFDEVGITTDEINKEDCIEWYFKTKNKTYSNNICCAIDELLGYETQDYDKFRIIIEKVDD